MKHNPLIPLLLVLALSVFMAGSVLAAGTTFTLERIFNQAFDANEDSIKTYTRPGDVFPVVNTMPSSRAVNRETKTTGQTLIWTLPFSANQIDIANYGDGAVTIMLDGVADGTGTGEVKLLPSGAYSTQSEQEVDSVSVYFLETAEVCIEVKFYQIPSFL